MVNINKTTPITGDSHKASTLTAPVPQSTRPTKLTSPPPTAPKPTAGAARSAPPPTAARTTVASTITTQPQPTNLGARPKVNSTIPVVPIYKAETASSTMPTSSITPATVVTSQLNRNTPLSNRPGSSSSSSSSSTTLPAKVVPVVLDKDAKRVIDNVVKQALSASKEAAKCDHIEAVAALNRLRGRAENSAGGGGDSVNMSNHLKANNVSAAETLNNSNFELSEHGPMENISLEEAEVIQGTADYLSTGQVESLPVQIQGLALAIQAESGFDPIKRPHERCYIIIAMVGIIDETALGKLLLNTMHMTARSMASVFLPTVARLAAGKALDLALVSIGVAQPALMILGLTAMALPGIGQIVNGVRDEMNQNATPYSRMSRSVLTLGSLGMGIWAATSGTMINPGMRFAEVILYPLLRDPIQTLFPIMVTPDNGPSWGSLTSSGILYAGNQIGVSRAFVAYPQGSTVTTQPVSTTTLQGQTVSSQPFGTSTIGAINSSSMQSGSTGITPEAMSEYVFSVSGLMQRGFWNAVGEAADLVSLLYLNHWSRNGVSSPQPKIRIGRGELKDLRSQAMWDTALCRGQFVSTFSQIYDTMLEGQDNAFVKWIGKTYFMNSAGQIDLIQAAKLADWITEGVVAAATVVTYMFWTDPIHMRSVNLPTPSGNDNLTHMQRGDPRAGNLPVTNDVRRRRVGSNSTTVQIEVDTNSTNDVVNNSFIKFDCCLWAPDSSQQATTGLMGLPGLPGVPGKYKPAP